MGEPGQQVVDDDEHCGYHDEGRDQVSLERGQGLAAADQFRVQDQEPQRRVLQDDDELADDGGQHQGDGLRQQHQPKRREGCQSNGQARLPLTLWQRPDSGADELSDNGGVVERQTRDDAEQRKSLAGNLETEEEEVVGEEHHHQHRNGAEELHKGTTGHPHRSQLRQTAHAQQDAADDREDD